MKQAPLLRLKPLFSAVQYPYAGTKYPHRPPIPPLITGCVYTYHQISYKIDFDAAELAGKSIA